MIITLMEIRDAAKDVAKAWKDHTRKIEEGSIVERQGLNIRITENVDRQLGRLVGEFLSGATRSFKGRMQQTARMLGLEIGFLYQKQAASSEAWPTLRRRTGRLPIICAKLANGGQPGQHPERS